MKLLIEEHGKTTREVEYYLKAKGYDFLNSDTKFNNVMIVDLENKTVENISYECAIEGITFISPRDFLELDKINFQTYKSKIVNIDGFDITVITCTDNDKINLVSFRENNERITSRVYDTYSNNFEEMVYNEAKCGVTASYIATVFYNTHPYADTTNKTMDPVKFEETKEDIIYTTTGGAYRRINKKNLLSELKSIKKHAFEKYTDEIINATSFDDLSKEFKTDIIKSDTKDFLSDISYDVFEDEDMIYDAWLHELGVENLVIMMIETNKVTFIDWSKVRDIVFVN